MAWDEAAFGAGAPSKQRQTKAQECQMEIGLHSPRRIRCVIKAGWEGFEGHLHSQRTSENFDTGLVYISTPSK